jgi:hypothetical protein
MMGWGCPLVLFPAVPPAGVGIAASNRRCCDLIIQPPRTQVVCRQNAIRSSAFGERSPVCQPAGLMELPQNCTHGSVITEIGP